MDGFFNIETNYPIAIDSPDHISPWGTLRDNSKNPRFNNKLHQLFKSLDRPLKILDLGCSGGGFVKTCLDEGCLAIGLEGSDYSKKHARAEWPLLGGKFLFTTDITRKFTILKENKSIRFDVITSWEVMEHLPEERLPTVCENIKVHLEDQGIVILSISPNEEIIKGHRLHLTVKKQDWWIDLFKRHGLFHIDRFSSYFNNQYIRGPKQNAPESFHLFLVKDKDLIPSIPSLRLRAWLLDKWHMSKMQKFLQKLLGIVV